MCLKAQQKLMEITNSKILLVWVWLKVISERDTHLVVLRVMSVKKSFSGKYHRIPVFIAVVIKSFSNTAS